jgi:hypothetical protein
MQPSQAWHYPACCTEFCLVQGKLISSFSSYAAGKTRKREEGRNESVWRLGPVQEKKGEKSCQKEGGPARQIGKLTLPTGGAAGGTSAIAAGPAQGDSLGRPLHHAQRNAIEWRTCRPHCLP